jgi:diguanylate cyclase (GGDEF)-like protein
VTSPLPDDIARIAPLLDVLCPMHLLLDPEGRILRTGRALDKLGADMPPFTGRAVLEVLTLRRPKAEPTITALRDLAGRKLHLSLAGYPKGELKGVVVPVAQPDPDAAPYLVLNLSFGISIVDAVRDFGLTSSDFAVTDLAVEMLFLVEAQSAVLKELKRLNSRLDTARQTALEQATTDQLTGLANRRAMDPALGRLKAASTGFALLHLDLDYFKEVNDTHGHAAGDHVLRVAAERLIRCTRADDLVLRLGGDEFMLILADVTTTHRVRRVATRVIAALEEPIAFEDQMLRISASIGASLAAPGVEVETDRLMQEADSALYAAKEAGRGRFHIFGQEGEDEAAPGPTPPDD